MAQIVVEAPTGKRVNTFENLKIEYCDIIQKVCIPVWYKLTPLEIRLHSNFMAKYARY